MKYQTRKDGEPYNPVIECGRCRRITIHVFIGERGKAVKDYTKGYNNAPLRLDIDKNIVYVIGFEFMCKNCGEKRFWGNQG